MLFITAKIAFTLISHTAVHMYDFYIFAVMLAGVINKYFGKVTHELLVLLLGFSQVNINLCKKFSSWPFAHKADSLPLYSSILNLELRTCIF